MRIWKTLCIMLLICQSMFASIEISGTFRGEIISDPLNFDPSKTQTSHWRSGDRGGKIMSSYYLAGFTKLGLQIKAEDSIGKVFIPITLGIAPFGTAATPSWQVYMVADDYLNIPYYMQINGNHLVFSGSNRSVDDKEFGFQDAMDPLGIWRRPNSYQPMLTFKVDINLSDDWKGQGYVLFDQLVEGVPYWEEMPGIAGETLLEGVPLNKYRFIDEEALYNLLILNRSLSNDSKLSFLWGQKYVDNPSFRLLDINDPQSNSIKWNLGGYLKQNFAISLDKKITNNFEVQSMAALGEVKWRKYASTSAHPHENIGQLSGNAVSLNGKFDYGDSTFRFAGLVVDPDFQAVAAVHEFYPVMNRILPNEDGVLQRHAQAIYDPNYNIIRKKIVGSPIINYLGKRLFNVDYEILGEFGNKQPLALNLSITSVSGLSDIEERYYDEEKGQTLTKDFSEANMNLKYQNQKRSSELFALNREYFADTDYKRNIGIKYVHEEENYFLGGVLEKAWRLRNDSAYGEGSSLIANMSIAGSFRENKLALSTEICNGSYDYGLLLRHDDRIVKPFNHSNLKTYWERNKQFSRGKLTLVGEYTSQQTTLEDLETGSSFVSYMSLDTIFNKASSRLTYLGVVGPKGDDFPSKYLDTTYNLELKYKPFTDDNIHLLFGYTLRPTDGSNKQNGYAALTTILGPGTLSLSFGNGGFLSSLNKYDVNLPGNLQSSDEVYLNGEFSTQLLHDRPWENYNNNNFYDLWSHKLRSTEETWENYFRLCYLFNF